MTAPLAFPFRLLGYSGLIPFAAAAALALGLGGCAHTRNYTDPSGPRYAGRHAVPDPDPVLRAVTFNVKWGRQVDKVAALLRADPLLRDPDLLFLQEMSAAGVEKLAAELGYDYVYYPAAWHPRAHQDFGNAVLSRWPISDDRKLVLPELNRFRRMQRTTTAATVTRSSRRIPGARPGRNVR